MKESLQLAAQLVKLRISLAATGSALAVFALAGRGFGPRAWPLGWGVFLLSCGACALNEYRERDLDGLMKRTRGRPLPSGRLRPRPALAIALGLLAAGLPLIWRAGGAAGAVWAVAAVAWYDGVYTRLKKETPFAAVPGALVGVAPPLLGWLAAGRPWIDGRLLAVCFFFYLWQVPHFWLLAPECDPDLERAGLPSLRAALGEARVGRVVAVWMSVTAASAMLLPLFGATSSAASLLLLAAAALWLTFKAAGVLKAWPGLEMRCGLQLNVFLLAVMSVMALDPYLG